MTDKLRVWDDSRAMHMRHSVCTVLVVVVVLSGKRETNDFNPIPLPARTPCTPASPSVLMSLCRPFFPVIDGKVPSQPNVYLLHYILLIFLIHTPFRLSLPDIPSPIIHPLRALTLEISMKPFCPNKEPDLPHESASQTACVRPTNLSTQWPLMRLQSW